MAKNNARIVPKDLYEQAGLCVPDKKHACSFNNAGPGLKSNIKKLIRILDEQNAIGCFKWVNLPVGMSSQELERLLYYRGQLAFFYLEELNQFYVLPYALDGTIDAYGRYNTIHPVPIASGSKDKQTQEKEKALADYLATKKFDVLYDVVTPEEMMENPEYYLTKTAVIIWDYTKQLGETILSRRDLMDPLTDVMAECIPFMRTALQNSAGVSGVKVNNEDEAVQVQLASTAIQNATLVGEKWVPMQGGLDFQDLGNMTVAKPEEYLLAMQGLDNFRLSLHGLDNGGLFQKKSHMLEAEQEMNAGNMSLILKDRLNQRQRSCDIINSVWATGIGCMPSEEIINADLNGDGLVATDTEADEAPRADGGTQTNDGMD